MNKPLSALLLVVLASAGVRALAQQGDPPAAPAAVAVAGSAAAYPILNTAVSNLHPGQVPPAPAVVSPVANDPNAVERGMKYFVAFNCVGCHAPNGGGGMGPSLSDSRYIYGSKPANLFLSIFQGRPNGMPAWGQALPESTIWDLVAYVQSIGEPRGPQFGRTISRTPLSPAIQQTPAEFVNTASPWNFTEPFTNGQEPNGK